ncbi:hypothetical protein EZV62_022263 [Acer yangbiense]|uniref:Integrase catalytic domain-containing protein n=1 Tax=Acer yangbiense TaxID=1000413 RepID=A0A5C7H856_9ROSI|nr:hypothetical protein EZV62_022263 [Acer yangbiense]
MAVIADQFQKLLATQLHAMSTSSPKDLLSSSSSSMSSSIWVLDSGATHHMSPDLSSFVSLCPTSSVSVMTVDGSPIPLAVSAIPEADWDRPFLVSTGALGNLQSHDISDCSGCKLAKFSALPFNQSISSSLAPFDLVHSDVWGPSLVATKGGSRYYVSFIDDCTRFCWVYLIKRRSDTM